MRGQFSSPPPTFNDYAEVIGSIFLKHFNGPIIPTLFIEPGTALVADTQEFYARVVSTKNIRGVNYANISGSIFDISPVARCTTLPVSLVPSSPRTAESLFKIVGFTCIEGDVLTHEFSSDVRADDYIVYGNVGSYSVVMRPPFITPSSPILVKAINGDVSLAKRRQSNEDVFRDYLNF